MISHPKEEARLLARFLDVVCTTESEHRITSHWRHNEGDGISNHRRLDCLLNRLFRRRSEKTSKLRVTCLREGNSPVTGEFPAQGPVRPKMLAFDDVIMGHIVSAVLSRTKSLDMWNDAAWSSNVYICVYITYIWYGIYIFVCVCLIWSIAREMNTRVYVSAADYISIWNPNPILEYLLSQTKSHCGAFRQ